MGLSSRLKSAPSSIFSTGRPSHDSRVICWLRIVFARSSSTSADSSRQQRTTLTEPSTRRVMESAVGWRCSCNVQRHCLRRCRRRVDARAIIREIATRCGENGSTKRLSRATGIHRGITTTQRTGSLYLKRYLAVRDIAIDIIKHSDDADLIWTAIKFFADTKRYLPNILETWPRKCRRWADEALQEELKIATREEPK
jgi:hypothetical protein